LKIRQLEPIENKKAAPSRVREGRPSDFCSGICKNAATKSLHLRVFALNTSARRWGIQRQGAKVQGRKGKKSLVQNNIGKPFLVVLELFPDLC